MSAGNDTFFTESDNLLLRPHTKGGPGSGKTLWLVFKKQIFKFLLQQNNFQNFGVVTHGRPKDSEVTRKRISEVRMHNPFGCWSFEPVLPAPLHASVFFRRNRFWCISVPLGWVRTEESTNSQSPAIVALLVKLCDSRRGVDSSSIAAASSTCLGTVNQGISWKGIMPPTFLLASSFTGSKLQTPFAVQNKVSSADASSASPGIIVCQQKEKDQNGSEKVRTNTESKKMSRRETILRSSGSALLLGFLNFAGERPDYLGVQSNPPSLALCPPTPSCISTSEELNDPTHYVPPWTYNPQDGRGRKNPASKEKAMAELIDAIKTEKPDNFTPRIVKQTDDYIYVEYSSPLVGFVDDVEFWFPPGNRSLVEYRSASRREGIDFGFNRK